MNDKKQTHGVFCWPIQARASSTICVVEYVVDTSVEPFTVRGQLK